MTKIVAKGHLAYIPEASSKGAILNSLSATSNADCKLSGAVLFVRFS